MKLHITISLILCTILSCFSCTKSDVGKTPVDYVNPYLGNISHILVPTYPTVHLPNSMLRIYPERDDFTSDQIEGLPVIVTSHRGNSAFNISPVNGKSPVSVPVKKYTYDNESITPYHYSVFLDEEDVNVDYSLSHQSGIYNLTSANDELNYIVVNTRKGKLEQVDESTISGYQCIGESEVKVYLYLESQSPVKSLGALIDRTVDYSKNSVEGIDQALVLEFATGQMNLRYGVSFISTEQAKRNLRREIDTYDVNVIAEIGRSKWNEVLGKIEVNSPDEDNKILFYTSLYRTYERMINISEDGFYYSAMDNTVHADQGISFYTDDWAWDTYRATHPLRVLIESDMEIEMIQSYMRMAQQTKEGWMPTFPEVTGDSHRMNGNHIVASVWDAYCKGLCGFDLEVAYDACKKALTEKSLLPWKRTPNTELDLFYRTNGYYPALRHGEKEYVEEVDSWEKRQSVAVTLGTCFDDWCLSQIAKELGKDADYSYFLKQSYNYRNLYNPETMFFHPKDINGNFIYPFDYTFSGGLGAREFYDENNAWIYRWDVPHNPADLISLMGGADRFVANLDQTFREPLGKSKYAFYSQLPDQTGNVGQFSMANEPALHIPYLYNYAGQPWKTQKRIRELLRQWFRNDLMGMPGDEDGGGMSAFVVFSAMGFYPVTPGLPVYNIGSPLFENIKMKLSNGNIFEIDVRNFSEKNKYIQSASLNGIEWNKPWFHHNDIINGAKLILVMGEKANRNWGASLRNSPPSLEN